MIGAIYSDILKRHGDEGRPESKCHAWIGRKIKQLELARSLSRCDQ
jgi:hypothetical protein